MTIPRMSLPDWLALIVPLTLFAEVTLVGRLFAPDILLTCLLPILLVYRGRKLATALPRTFVVLGIVWLLGQIVTDLWRSTAFEDYVRGWAKIGFTITNFSAIYLLLNGLPRRIVLYALGIASGRVAEFFINPSPYVQTDPWKFGYGDAVTLVIVLCATAMWQQGRVGAFIAVLAIGAASVLNIMLGYRSLGGVLFLVFLILSITTVKRRRSGEGDISSKEAALLFVLMLAAGWAGLELYGRAADQGLLGAIAEEKYEEQTGQVLFGVLLGGRSEALASIPAIMEAPYLGHGSWAKNCAYSSLWLERRRELGYLSGEGYEECLIPTHSHLFGGWVEAGFSGAVFWIWVLILAGRAIARTLSSSNKLVVLTSFLGILLIWDVFFSPYGAARRFVTPFYIIVMMACVEGAIRKASPDRSQATRSLEQSTL